MLVLPAKHSTRWSALQPRLIPLLGMVGLCFGWTGCVRRAPENPVWELKVGKIDTLRVKGFDYSIKGFVRVNQVTGYLEHGRLRIPLEAEPIQKPERDVEWENWGVSLKGIPVVPFSIQEELLLEARVRIPDEAALSGQHANIHLQFDVTFPKLGISDNIVERSWCATPPGKASKECQRVLIKNETFNQDFPVYIVPK